MSAEKTLSLARRPGKWILFTWYVCVMLTLVILLGAVPVYYSRLTQPMRFDSHGLGQYSLPFQVLVDLGDIAGSFIGLILAIFLFWRKPDDRMALFVSFFSLLTAITGLYVLNNFLTAYFGAPPTYELWSSLQTPLWILLFCIFPDGRFVPGWTRWLFLASIPTSLGIFAGPQVYVITNAISFPLFFVVAYAQVYRYRRVSSHMERQQTKWVVLGILASMVLSVIASLVYKQISPPLLNVVPLALAVAVLRSHLFDIDLIIRRTVTYSILTAILGAVYFGLVIVAQQLFRAVTGQDSEIAIIVSTLAIALMFVPLRRRVQDFLDRRFYRKKYDAQQVLSKFAQTARDETDIDKLTNELIRVVDETMQPERVELWLKRTRDQRQRTE